MAGGLSRREYWAILAGAVLAFLVIDGPIWSDPFDIDRAVFASYALIPLAVAFVLVRGRRFGGKVFALATFELVVLKYAVTCTIAAILWSVSGEPRPRAALAIAEPARADAEPARRRDAGRPIDPSTTRTITGTAKPGALVFVKSGVESWRFEAPSEPVIIENDGRGFVPPLAIVEVGRPIILRARDHRLHTALAVAASGDQRFNYPVLAPENARENVLPHGAGVLELRCSVHRGEPKARIVLVHGSLWTRADAEGRYAIANVPPGEVELGFTD